MSGRRIWMLPEDGIIDPVAVDIAVRGTRPVRLTPGERREAAARIVAAGGTTFAVARRLHLNMTEARKLAALTTFPVSESDRQTAEELRLAGRFLDSVHAGDLDAAHIIYTALLDLMGIGTLPGPEAAS